MEWVEEPYAKGTMWKGSLDGKVLATVYHLNKKWGGRIFYYLNLGAAGDHGGDSNSVESSKRAAQSALTKIVKFLTEEN
jgi:hypothetical protein